MISSLVYNRRKDRLQTGHLCLHYFSESYTLALVLVQRRMQLRQKLCSQHYRWVWLSLIIPYQSVDPGIYCIFPWKRLPFPSSFVNFSIISYLREGIRETIYPTACNLQTSCESSASQTQTVPMKGSNKLKEIYSYTAGTLPNQALRGSFTSLLTFFNHWSSSIRS